MASPDIDESNTFWSQDALGAMFGLRLGKHRSYRLVVEMASDEVWEWTTWPVDQTSLAQCGRADTRGQAMRQADAAIRKLEERPAN